MRTNRNMLTALVCPLLFAAGLTGCGDLFTEDAGVCAMPSVTEPSYVMFNVTSVSNSGRTRANPTGGEWGDGREIGQTYENEVTSLAVFLYQDQSQSQTGKGVNGEADTPVTMLYFNNNEVSGEQNTTASTDNNIDYIATTDAKEVQLDAGQYNVLAIANPKDLTWASEATNLTLGDVRDHIETSAWDETTTGDSGTTGLTTVYSSFLMTSENEGKGVTIESSNSKDNPAVAIVDVERMAARVDYQATGTFTINEDGEGNTTNEGDPTYQGATVTITGAAIVNNLTAGSYELKRTSGGPAGTGGTGTTSVTYLGEETADADGKATNYVIDPWTDEKTGGSTVTINNTTANISDLYGVYYPGYATDDDEQNPSYWADLVTAGTPVTDDDGTIWNIIGYTMENTTYADYTDKKYNTGAVFAATFTPAEGTVRNSFFNDDFGFTPGQSTFFRWNNILYATAEDMMAVAYPSTSTPAFVAGDKFGRTTFENISTIEGLAEFASLLRDDDPTGYKAYLQGIVEADDFDFPTDKSSLYWDNYMTDSIHCRTTDTGVDIGTDTRALLYAATDGAVRTYENSQCYYTWWIRHSNDGDNSANGIMEYSIVRNNIYKVRVNSVYSIGGDIPEEGVRAYVYVKNWTMLAPETINL